MSAYKIACLLASAPLATAAAQSAPVVVSAKMLVASVDVTKPLASPPIQLALRGSATQVSFTWQGPSAESFTQTYYPGPWIGGRPIFQASGTPGVGNSPVFGLYAEPGTWTLSQLEVCGSSGCSGYFGAQLSALFPTLSLQVSNPNTPDFTGPTLYHATITTPTVSLSSGEPITVLMHAGDDVSGVIGAYFAATAQNGTATFFGSYTYLRAPMANGVLASYQHLYPGAPTGTYQITLVSLVDAANNVTTIEDPVKIAKLFSSHTTFTVTP